MPIADSSRCRSSPDCILRENISWPSADIPMTWRGYLYSCICFPPSIPEGKHGQTDEQDQNADQAVARIFVDCVGDYQPARQDEEDRRVRVSWHAEARLRWRL